MKIDPATLDVLDVTIAIRDEIRSRLMEVIALDGAVLDLAILTGWSEDKIREGLAWRMAVNKCTWREAYAAWSSEVVEALK